MVLPRMNYKTKGVKLPAPKQNWITVITMVNLFKSINDLLIMAIACLESY
jgi:hypothetical protein